MYIFNQAGHERRLRRKVLPVLHQGFGPDSFIAGAGWEPNYHATGCFKLTWAAPSRREENREIFAADFDLDEDHVGDYETILERAINAHGDDLVVCITTETGYHREHLLAAIKAGAKNILVDKPAVNSFAEWREVNDAATAAGALIGVSFQHTMNAVVHQIAENVAKAVAAGQEVRLEAGFLQDWLDYPPMQIRQVWRLDDKWCGLKDIGSHAADAIAVEAGAEIETVLSSTHSMARHAERERPAFDNGECLVRFKNGLQGTVRYHQAKHGRADDIFTIAEIGDTAYQFALEWGGGDTMFRSTRGWTRSRQGWYAEQRGHSKMFSNAVNTAWGKNPPGHMQAWDTMWLCFFFSAYREILERQGDERSQYLVPLAQNKMPNFNGAGRHATLFVDAAIKSFETGEPVDLESVAV